MKVLLIVTILINMLAQPIFALTENASSAILLNYDTNEILYEKNSKERKYPASTTKIMTIIQIFEK